MTSSPSRLTCDLDRHPSRPLGLVSLQLHHQEAQPAADPAALAPAPCPTSTQACRSLLLNFKNHQPAHWDHGHPVGWANDCPQLTRFGLNLAHHLQFNLFTPQATLTLINQLSQLSTTLQSRRFSTFWALLDSPDLEPLAPVVSSIVEFENLIRHSISKRVASCFRTISTARLQSYLEFQDVDQVESWVARVGWSLVNGKAKVPDNSDNCRVTSLIRENTTLKGKLSLVHPSHSERHGRNGHSSSRDARREDPRRTGPHVRHGEECRRHAERSERDRAHRSRRLDGTDEDGGRSSQSRKEAEYGDHRPSRHDSRERRQSESYRRR